MYRDADEAEHGNQQIAQTDDGQSGRLETGEDLLADGEQ